MTIEKFPSLNRDINSILKAYWGYPDFRPLQEDIIQHAINQQDTLALLPTGGGKSICYQVPGLAMEGITLVISPLLALMKDQIEGLRSKGIKAETVNSFVSFRDTDRILDNCIYGQVKFLFVSPERLQNDLFKVRLAKMKLNLIAVDEAHCISQWGHDFRPAYRLINEIREIHPKVPVLALTASATPDVVLDIQEQLHFKNGVVIRKSFARENIRFAALELEDKRGALFRIMKKYGEGSCIVYVRNRRRAKELCDDLRHEGHSCGYYHAGLKKEEREEAQDLWLKGTTRIIVATNAFGMGIDKPDVRNVIHYDISDSLESYYQEAGRAGRDGKSSIAVQLFHLRDIQEVRIRLEKTFPSADAVKKVYQKLSDGLQLAAGSGQEETFPVDLADLSKRSELDVYGVMGALKTLEQNGYISIHEGLTTPSRIQMVCDRRQLDNLDPDRNAVSKVLFVLLRNHSGLFSSAITIREEEIALKAGMSFDQVESALSHAQDQGVLIYQARKGSSSVSYLLPRQHGKDLRLNLNEMKLRKARQTTRAEALISYFMNDVECRSVQMLNYFGESASEPCGTCDVCTRKKDLPSHEKSTWIKDMGLLKELCTAGIGMEQLKLAYPIHDPIHAQVFHWLLDKNYIRKSGDLIHWTAPLALT
ncbi:MAG: RecQ family ATP-dependent DNA helicase [Bacteroidetes bacterium]|nr:RecQ family ATP-dependent DNA helicase [Bacteroidota bacterium]